MATRFSTRSHHNGLAARIAGTALAGLLLAGTLTAAEPPDINRAAVRKAAQRSPNTDGRIPHYRVNQRLHLAYKTAFRKLEKLQSCRDLFNELDADGIEVLGSITYVLASEDWEKRVCENASAFTTIGGDRVWLCGQFGRLPNSEAALILLHEALHTAGLGEYPIDPDGPTPDEIDKMVESNCGF